MGATRICLLGASPTTGNLGVSALCLAALRGIHRTPGEPQVTVFDDWTGAGTFIFEADGKRHEIRRCGACLWRKIWRPESLLNIQWSMRLGGLGNPGARALAESDLILDASGGDSFTDLYGAHRYNTVTILKRTALARGKRLVLLPQTYGPFEKAHYARDAARILRRTAMAWARDAASYEKLQELLGADFDPQRHRCGVDMAFMLEALSPAEEECPAIRQILGQRANGPVIGVNVSGLAYNDPEGAARQYGFKADYRQVITGFLTRMLRETACSIVLVPHVVTPPGHFESDLRACEQAAGEVKAAERVRVLPAMEDPRHAKWVIGQMDWFCGTRMHATIAALSSGVPTAAIAYSVKTRGVFETCGQEAQVADLRKSGTEAIVEQLMASWNKRAEAQAALRQALPEVMEKAQMQMEAILQ